MARKSAISSTIAASADALDDDFELDDGLVAPSGEDSDSEDSEDGALETIQKRMNFVRKLQILLPKRDETTGKKDYRLLVLAIAFTIYRVGGLYTNDVGCQPVQPAK